MPSPMKVPVRNYRIDEIIVCSMKKAKAVAAAFIFNNLVYNYTKMGSNVSEN